MTWVLIALVAGLIVLGFAFAVRSGYRTPVEPLHDQPCPRCGLLMHAGRVEIKGTALGLLVIGLSFQHLWWYPDEGGQQIVLRSRVPAPAWRCATCGTTIIPP